MPGAQVEHEDSAAEEVNTTALLYMLLHYWTTALLHYWTTALPDYCNTGLLYYCTALLHYCTTALLHYCTTALLHCIALYYTALNSFMLYHFQTLPLLTDPLLLSTNKNLTYLVSSCSDLGEFFGLRCHKH